MQFFFDPILQNNRMIIYRTTLSPTVLLPATLSPAAKQGISTDTSNNIAIMIELKNVRPELAINTPLFRLVPHMQQILFYDFMPDNATFRCIQWSLLRYAHRPIKPISK